MNTKLFKFSKLISAVALIGLVGFATESTHAQTYVEGFEDLTKTSYSSETVSLNGGVQWNFTGANMGNTNNDYFVGTKSARLAGTTKASSNPDTAKIEMLNNNPGGIGEISFFYRQYGNDVQKYWRVEWSADGNNWLFIDSIIGQSTVDTFTYTLNEPNARIRVICAEFATGGSNTNRLNIDELVLTALAGTIAGPAITGKTPTGTNVPLSTNVLTITYDQDIEEGSGSILLHQVGGSTQTFTVPSPEVTIAGPIATIGDITLENDAAYYVTMTAGVFKSIGDTLTTEEITDSTYWAFSTVDTTPIIAISLNETFDVCNNTLNTFGVFHNYSVDGNKTWKCSSFAHLDSNAVYINGGSSAGVSEITEAWLISTPKFDFDAMTQPMLSFWQKARFTGDVVREVKISTDYIGSGDPTAATWTTLNIPALANIPSPNNTWGQISNVDLTAYKGTPFYLAFTYACGDQGAWELTYDDIVVEDNTTGIGNMSKGNLKATVLGFASSNQIKLSIQTEKASKITAEVYDMTGRILHTETFQTNGGQSIYNLSNMNLSAGMHIIRLSDGVNYGMIKAIVK